MAKKVVPLETAKVAGIINYLNGLENCRAHKVSGDAKKSGEPDIDAVLCGQAIKLEAKRPGRNEASSLQTEVLRRWEAAGAITGVVHDKSEVQALIYSRRPDLLCKCADCGKYYQPSQWNQMGGTLTEFCPRCIEKGKAPGLKPRGRGKP